jgi:hypothetical protein
MLLCVGIVCVWCRWEQLKGVKAEDSDPSYIFDPPPPNVKYGKNDGMKFRTQAEILESEAKFGLALRVRNGQLSPAVPIPDELMCPVTHEILVDPVIAADGFTYEREAIERWFQSRKTRCSQVKSHPLHLSPTPPLARRRT